MRCRADHCVTRTGDDGNGSPSRLPGLEGVCSQEMWSTCTLGKRSATRVEGACRGDGQDAKGAPRGAFVA